ncbi:MAG: hypothetical protein ACOC41_00775 [Chitinivibrionales bacterium]
MPTIAENWIQEGIKKGMEKGIEKGNAQTASENDFPVKTDSDIHDITSLSIRKIRELRKEAKERGAKNF